MEATFVVATPLTQNTVVTTWLWQRMTEGIFDSTFVAFNVGQQGRFASRWAPAT